jgi:hypothetical protein
MHSVPLMAAWIAIAWSMASGAADAADGLRPQDDFFLINVRGLGSSFCPEFDWERVLCRRLAQVEGEPCRRWITVPIAEFYAADNPAQLTLIFVHGNRVDPGEDIADTLGVYRAMLACAPHAPPIRLVAFSWPTEQIRGVLRDYREKAMRSDPAGLHLAHLLSHLRPDVPLALVGYSYGARVVSGALHVVAGGTLCGHALPGRANLADARVLLISAAVDRDWLLPGRPHGMALTQMERLVLVNNATDPAMRLYHVSSQGGRPTALGRFGLPGVPAVDDAPLLWQVDASRQVGKHHALKYYLASGPPLGLAARHLFSGEVLPASP